MHPVTPVAASSQLGCTMAGSGPSISEGSIAASQQDKLWVVDTLPTQWTLPVQTAAGPGRMLEKRSTCELEADACVEHVLNRGEVCLLACLSKIQGTKLAKLPYQLSGIMSRWC